VIARRSLLLSLLLLLGIPLPAAAQKGTIKLAVQAPLSGEQAALGEHIKLGAQLAVEEAIKSTQETW
jgi:hypothetical protein